MKLSINMPHQSKWLQPTIPNVGIGATTTSLMTFSIIAFTAVIVSIMTYVVFNFITISIISTVAFIMLDNTQYNNV